MVGMSVREKNGVQMPDIGRQKLFAQIRAGVDQQGLALLRDQDRGAAAAILRIGGIAAAPAGTDHRHAAGGAAAEDGDFHRGTFVKSEKKLSVVTSASAAGLSPLMSASTAAVCATKAGSQRLPRWGIGARKGESVSTNSFSSGKSRAVSRRSSDFLKVRMPDNEIYKPSSTAFSPRARLELKQCTRPGKVPLPISSSRMAMVSSSASRVWMMIGNCAMRAASIWARKLRFCASRGLCS